MSTPLVVALATVLSGCTQGHRESIAEVGLQPDPAWRSPVWSVDLAQHGAVEDLVLSPNGARVYVASAARVGDDLVPSVAAYATATGQRIWRFRSTRTANSSFGPQVALSPDGSRVYLHDEIDVGSSGNNTDIATWALRARDGASVWSMRYAGPAGRWDDATAVLAGPGRVYVTGQTWRTGGRQHDLWVRAYRATDGRPLWTRVIDGGGRAEIQDQLRASDGGLALALAPNGATLVVTGYRELPVAEIFTLAFQAGDGSLRWKSFDSHPEHYFDGRQYGFTVTVDDGVVFVGGGSESSEGAEWRPITLARELSSGQRLWLRVDEPVADSYGAVTGLAIDPASRAPIVAADVRQVNDTLFRAWSQEAATGATRWVATPSPDLPGKARDLALDPTLPRVYVGGTMGIDDSQLTVVAFSTADGSELWRGRADDGEATEVVVTDGLVIVGGLTSGPDPGGFLLAAFATSDP